MSIDPIQFRVAICTVLAKAAHYYPQVYSPEAVELLMGTAAQESGFGRYLYQLESGPARGFFQMEPSTETWLWKYMRKHPELLDAVVSICHVPVPSSYALTFKIDYQILMARIRYLPAPAKIPSSENIHGLGVYWDKFYNRNPDAGFPEEFVKNYNKYCA